MSLFFRNFHGEPLLNDWARDYSRFEDSDGQIRQFDERSHEADLCDLMEGAAAAIHRSRTPRGIFGAAPGVEVLESILREAVNRCADEGVLAMPALHYHDLCRDWMDALAAEGIDVPCPSGQAFRGAVEAELRRRHGSDDRGEPATATLPAFGK